eukprot:Partr_v1_DN27986_c1_g1_i1_m11048 putative Zinc finger protein
MEKKDDDDICPICTDSITIYGFGPCNHRVCHVCCIRLRALYKKLSCALCKSECKSVILTSDRRPDIPFASFNLKSMLFDRKLSAYCDDQETLDDITTLLRFNCPDTACDQALANWAGLKDHVRKSHKRVLCEICIRHKKIFAHEHQLYTQASLLTHKKEGDGDPSFRGHPECRFCLQFFYSADELFEHCRERHEECHVCRQKGVKDQYFRDYNSLEEHFGSDHYLCRDRECLEKKFVVFDSEIDFKGHMATEHAGTMSKEQQRQTRRIDVGFQSSPSRGGGRGGSSSNASVRGRAPPGFGSRLSQTTRKNDDSVESAATGVDSLQVSTPRHDWPSLAAGDRAPPAQIFPPLGVTRVFDALLDQNLVSVVNTREILDAERIVAQKVAIAVGHDPQKWGAFKSNCINYIRGAILPERFYGQIDTILGQQFITRSFKIVVNIFPEHLRAPLLRVHEDKKVRQQDFPDLEPALANLSSSSRAKILVIKSKKKGSFNGGKDSSGRPWVSDSMNSQTLSTTTAPSQQFPALQSSKPSTSVASVNFDSPRRNKFAPKTSWVPASSSTAPLPSSTAASQQFPSLPSVPKKKMVFSVKSTKNSSSASDQNPSL